MLSMSHFVSLLRISCGVVHPSTASQNLKHFLLRGSTVRNTHHVIGLVVHLGHIGESLFLDFLANTCKTARLELGRTY